MAQALKGVFNDLEIQGQTVTPYQFIQVFMQLFPEFNHRTKEGAFEQQDADECFSNILKLLQPICFAKNEEDEQVNLIDQLFQIR